MVRGRRKRFGSREGGTEVRAVRVRKTVRRGGWKGRGEDLLS